MKKILSILAMIIVSVGLTGCGNKTENEITFAQLSDIHIEETVDSETGGPTTPERLLLDAIEQINENPKVDFTLVTGDLVNRPDYDLFQHSASILSGLNKPWYFGTGNHDSVYNGYIPLEDIVSILKKENKDYTFDTLDYSFKPENKKGFIFIGMNGGAGNFSPEQLKFLDDTLTNNQDCVAVIFTHGAVLPPVDNQPEHDYWNKDEILEVLQKHSQPIAVIAGHYHVTKIIQNGNIIHVASPSLRYAQEFRIINIKNEKDKTVFNFEYKRTKLEEDFQNESRYEGEDKDRETTLIVEKNSAKQEINQNSENENDQNEENIDENDFDENPVEEADENDGSEVEE